MRPCAQSGTAPLLFVLILAGCVSKEVAREPIEANSPSCREWNAYAFFEHAVLYVSLFRSGCFGLIGSVRGRIVHIV